MKSGTGLAKTSNKWEAKENVMRWRCEMGDETRNKNGGVRIKKGREVNEEGNEWHRGIRSRQKKRETDRKTGRNGREVNRKTRKNRRTSQKRRGRRRNRERNCTNEEWERGKKKTEKRLENGSSRCQKERETEEEYGGDVSKKARNKNGGIRTGPQGHRGWEKQQKRGTFIKVSEENGSKVFQGRG